MKSDKIVWSQSSIEELKAILADQDQDDLDESEEQISLDFPWEIVVIKQQTVTDESGGTSVNAVLGFDEVDGAEDYEVRISLIEEDGAVTIGPISEWTLNGGGGYLTGINSAVFTEEVTDKRTTANYPILVKPNWDSITLSVTVERPTIDADGFAIALADSAFYASDYVGNGGCYVGFFNSGAESGTAMDTTDGRYCAYDESMYVPTGNEGPTIRFNDGITKTRINTLDSAAWASSADGVHDYVVTWNKTGANTANMRVTYNGTLIISRNNAWVPQSARLFITAATGSADNVHIISGVGGYIEY